MRGLAHRVVTERETLHDHADQGATTCLATRLCNSVAASAPKGKYRSFRILYIPSNGPKEPGANHCAKRRREPTFQQVPQSSSNTHPCKLSSLSRGISCRS